MNERIKELERQARQLAQEAVDQKKYNTYSEYQQSLSDQSYAKFAELIVEEFRNVLADEYRKTPLECCGHFLRADETIAKHFYGV